MLYGKIYKGKENNHLTDQLLSDFYRRLQSASYTWIPKYKPRKFYTKPWWSSECHNLWRERERLYLKYKRTCTNADKEAWLNARALATRTFKVSKQEQWIMYVTSLNENTPISKVWDQVSRIRGRPPTKYTF